MPKIIPFSHLNKDDIARAFSKIAKENFRYHNPSSSILLGEIKETDVIIIGE